MIHCVLQRVSVCLSVCQLVGAGQVEDSGSSELFRWEQLLAAAGNKDSDENTMLAELACNAPVGKVIGYFY